MLFHPYYNGPTPVRLTYKILNIIRIYPVSFSESEQVNLVAIASCGIRLYFGTVRTRRYSVRLVSCSSSSSSWVLTSQMYSYTKKRPQGLYLQHIRIPPSRRLPSIQAAGGNVLDPNCSIGSCLAPLRFSFAFCAIYDGTGSHQRNRVFFGQLQDSYSTLLSRCIYLCWSAAQASLTILTSLTSHPPDELTQTQDAVVAVSPDVAHDISIGNALCRYFNSTRSSWAYSNRRTIIHIRRQCIHTIQGNLCSCPPW